MTQLSLLLSHLPFCSSVPLELTVSGDGGEPLTKFKRRHKTLDSCFNTVSLIKVSKNHAVIIN